MMSESSTPADRWRLWLATFIDFGVLPNVVFLLILYVLHSQLGAFVSIIFTGFLVPLYMTAARPSSTTVGSILVRTRPFDNGDTSSVSRAPQVTRLLTIATATYIAWFVFALVWFFEAIEGEAHSNSSYWIRMALASCAFLVGPGSVGGFVAAYYRSTFVNERRSSATTIE